jgi:hypothetical protein
MELFECYSEIDFTLNFRVTDFYRVVKSCLFPLTPTNEMEFAMTRSKHVQFTKISSSSKLTFVFSETNVSVSFPTPSRPYPQLLCIK